MEKLLSLELERTKFRIIILPFTRYMTLGKSILLPTSTPSSVTYPIATYTPAEPSNCSLSKHFTQPYLNKLVHVSGMPLLHYFHVKLFFMFQDPVEVLFPLQNLTPGRAKYSLVFDLPLYYINL